MPNGRKAEEETEAPLTPLCPSPPAPLRTFPPYCPLMLVTPWVPGKGREPQSYPPICDGLSKTDSLAGVVPGPGAHGRLERGMRSWAVGGVLRVADSELCGTQD